MVARPKINVGDTVSVDTVIRDGDKRRIQKFKGIVIATKGKGVSKTFTVRKISYGIGVEKIFPLYSPNVESIEIIKHATVRRSKLYYLRDRVGKAATTLRGGKDLTEDSNKLQEVEVDEEEVMNEEIEDSADQAEEDQVENTEATNKENASEATEEKKEEAKDEKSEEEK